MLKLIKKTTTISLVSILLIQMVYSTMEPKIAMAATATDNVVVTLVVGSGITITTPGDVTMSPAIGMTSDTSIGSVVWNVESNNANGYSLGVKASASPALVSAGGSFADYTETSAGAPELWSIDVGTKEFGYSAFGSNINTTTWGTGANCGTGGAPSTTLKYIGFETTDKIVAQQSGATGSSGVDSTVCFAAEQNDVYAPSGTYTATITATATEL